MEKIKVEINLPVLNEERVLKDSVKNLRDFLKNNMHEYDFRIVVVDNGSMDKTKEVGQQLSFDYSDVGYLRLEKKGRGRALRTAWNISSADILCYMDIDLSTDLEALPKLIKAIVVDGNDISIGSRLMKGAKTNRSFKREIISRGYLFLMKIILGTTFSDVQCGFKAVNRTVVTEVLPHVLDQEWFFDSELLFKSKKWGYKIKEIPVVWKEDSDSRVKIYKTVKNFIKSLIRLKLEFSIDRIQPNRIKK